MGYPDLSSDESIILTTQNVIVKSVPFEAILTSRRLVLINSRERHQPPIEIPLSAIRNFESGENGIRDPTITLTISTGSGETKETILTLSRSVRGGERKRERDELLKLLRDNVAATIRETGITHAQVRAEPASAGTGPDSTPRHQKKKREVAHPIKKIIETVPAPPRPIEITSLPQGSFCSRCGNRVPPESAFCNRCGTPIVHPSQHTIVPPPPAPVQPPVPEAKPEPIPQPVPPAPAQPSTVPQVAVPMPAPVTQDKKARPIEEIIHSIEPLIEDSVPRKEPAPPVPSSSPVQRGAETQPADTQSDQAKPADTPAGVTEALPVRDEGTEAAAAPAADGTPSPAPSHEQPAPTGISTTPPKKSNKLLIAGAVTAVIAIAVIAILVMPSMIGGKAGVNLTPLQTATPTPSPKLPITTLPVTPEATATEQASVTPAETVPPQVVIPTSGVWVHVAYKGKYKGSYGTPGSQREVTETTGDHVYQIPTSTGVVDVSFVKTDGSADLITVKLYKDGALIAQDSTTAPRGTAWLQTDIKTLLKPTEIPETTAAPVTTHVA
jgi:hypothetical protein